MSYLINTRCARHPVQDITAQFNHVAGEVEKYRRLLDYLEQGEGYKDPILYGGALRDIYMGLPFRDLDILTLTAFEPDHSLQIPEVPRKIVRLGDYIIDFNHRPQIQSAAIAAQQGDAPINAIAMGTDGVIWASEYFIQHAKAGVYAPWKAFSGSREHANERYRKLQAHIPLLTFVEP